MSIKLASRVYSEVEYAPDAELKKGGFVAATTLGGSLNGFVGFADIPANEPGTIVVKAEKAIATKDVEDSLAFAPGEIVRYNADTEKVTKTGSDPAIGYAKKAALATDDEVVLEFDGAMGIAAGETITLSQITDIATLTIEKAQITDLDELALSDLADVDVTGVDDKDRLAYDLASTTWKPEAVS